MLKKMWRKVLNFNLKGLEPPKMQALQQDFDHLRFFRYTKNIS